MSGHGAGTVSLNSSIRTCRVDSGEANRLESDRFLNPMNMVCPIWNGFNLKGQQVCPDSFYTKSPGCNSAEDRVVVENNQRPKYFDYITLNAGGLQGNIYGNVEAQDETVAREKMLQSRNKISGHFGNQWGATRRYTGCSIDAYNRAMAQEAQTMRGQNFMQNGYQANSMMGYSGN